MTISRQFTLYTFEDINITATSVGVFYNGGVSSRTTDADLNAITVNLTDEDGYLEDQPGFYGANDSGDNQILTETITDEGQTFLAEGSKIYALGSGVFENETTGEIGTYWVIGSSGQPGTEFGISTSIPINAGDTISYTSVNYYDNALPYGTIVEPEADPDGIVDGEDFGEVMELGYDDSNDPTDGGGDLITEGDDVIVGGGGDDTIDGEGGGDLIYGDGGDIGVSDSGTAAPGAEASSSITLNAPYLRDQSDNTPDEVRTETIALSDGVTSSSVEVTYALTGESGLVLINSNTVGLNTSGGVQSDWVNNSDEPFLVMDFADEVDGVTFDITDLDENVQFNYDDKVTILAFDADGNPVPISISGTTHHLVSEDGSNGVLTVEGEGDWTQNAYADAGTDDAVSISVDGPVARIEIIHTNGAEANFSGYVEIENIEHGPILIPSEPVEPGAPGDDVIYGGTGEDTIYGNEGNDTIDGGADDDLIYGGGDDDSLDGGTGNDTIFGDSGENMNTAKQGAVQVNEGDTSFSVDFDTADCIHTEDVWFAVYTGPTSGRIIGNDTITEGNTREYNVKLDDVVAEDTYVTVMISDGSAKQAGQDVNEFVVYYGSNGGYNTGTVQGETVQYYTIDQVHQNQVESYWYNDQVYKSGATNLDNADGNYVGVHNLVNDFKIIDSDGNEVIGKTFTVLVPAGSDTSESFDVVANKEVNVGKNVFGKFQTESDEYFDLEITRIGDKTNVEGDKTIKIDDVSANVSPIAFDLNDDGEINTTGTETHKGHEYDGGDTVEFDLDDDGTKERVEWLDGSGDGFLIDTNVIADEGKVDGSALFGDEGGEYSSGYEKLSALKDTNNDGVISGDELDGLAVWVDDGDGIYENGESRTLEELGIDSISTGYTTDSEGRMVSCTKVDAEAIGSVQYSIKGPDAHLFQIDADTGEVTYADGFVPDFEDPQDADGDNIYDLIVVRHGDNLQEPQEQPLHIQVNNVEEPGDGLVDGNDTITGEDGADVMYGEGGDDTFVVDKAEDGDGDVVVGGNGPDDTTDHDVLDLRGAGRVVISKTADDSDDGAYKGTVTFENGEVLEFSQIETILTDPQNEDPDAKNDSFSGDEDTEITGNVLANDTDPDGDSLQVVELVTGAANGTVILSDDGSFSYTPNANFNGADSFTYKVSDGNGGFDTATVNLTVNPVNDAPEAVDDLAVTEFETDVVIDVLSNDTDVDGDDLEVIAASSPDGNVSVNPDGTLTFTPADGFEGAAKITYTVSDGKGGTDEGEVTVTVSSEPLDGIVQGTGGDDMIGTDYEDDPQGDKIDNNDEILPGEGPNDDIIRAGDGDDTVLAGDGNDEVYGEDGDDSLLGGDGDDYISGGEGFDVLEGGKGSDTLDAGQDGDTLDGGEGDDSLLGGAKQDSIIGGDGDDTIKAGNATDTVDAGDGNDTVYGEGGDDLITTGNGDILPDRGYPGVFPADSDTEDDRDFVDGGLGDDTISTGDDADTIFGGEGADQIDGGIDDDEISGDDGADRIVGGEGSDTILGGLGDDTIHAGNDPDLGLDILNIEDDGTNPFGPDEVTDNGKDLVRGGEGNDLITGADDDDTLFGDTGNDTIDGGIDDDSIEGGEGNDSLIGGQGDDTILGGLGDDEVEGGIGADSLSGGADRDTFSDLTAGDTVDGGGAGDDFDVLDLTGSKTDVDGKLRVTLTGPDSNGNGSDGFVTYYDKDWNETGRLDFTEIEEIIPCFTPGTLVATPRGEVPVETLEAGDQVITRDNGIQTIRWAGARQMTAEELAEAGNLRPVLIRQGALGKGQPQRDMLVSPNHRVLVNSGQIELLFEENEVLVAAKHLVGLEGIERVNVDEITYIHVMFDQHEVILSDGAWTESFQPGDMSLKGVGRAQREEILAIFPELATIGGVAAYGAARRVLKKHEAALLQH